MQIFYTAVDQGDGSLGVEFFDNAESISILEYEFPESYSGEGGGSFHCYEFDGELETLEETKNRLN